MESLHFAIKLPTAFFGVTEIMCNDVRAEVPHIEVQQNLRMGLWDAWLFCRVDFNVAQYG